LLELVQCGFHLPAMVARRASADPVPALQKLLPRPVFDGLCLMQFLAPIRGDARVEDVVMAALDDVDGVDL